MDKNQSLQQLDDWQIVCQHLPQGWEEAARQLGALHRTRGIPNADVLLRVLMVHLADGCSLKETALRAHQAGWCTLSSVAVFKRLQAAEQDRGQPPGAARSGAVGRRHRPSGASGP